MDSSSYRLLSTNTVQQGVQHLVEIAVLVHAGLYGIDGIHDGAVVHVVEGSPNIAEGGPGELPRQIHGDLSGKQDRLLA